MQEVEFGMEGSSMSEDKPTLSVGKYIIELAKGGFGVFATDEFGEKQWVATAPDPEVAMKIVEGLIMVEMKRFYHPESKPVLKGKDDKPLPPFLRTTAQTPEDPS
jgi:hypothetical protein